MARLAEVGGPTWISTRLFAQELDTGASVDSTNPVTPEKWRIPHSQRMQQNTDLARLLGGLALPLALLAQRTRTTPADAGFIHHAQAAIGFSALLMDTKLLVCWTAKGSVWLEREIVA
jgi:hypothetical protein